VNNTGTKKKIALWNKRHFEEKNGECAACLKYSVLIFVGKKYIKCNIWRVAVRPSCIWDARFLKVKRNTELRSRNHCCRRKIIALHILSVCLCSLFGTQSAWAVLYCNLWHVWLDNIFPHFLIKSTTLGGGGIVWRNIIGRKICVLIVGTILSAIFLILRRIQRDIITNVHRSSWKVILVRF